MFEPSHAKQQPPVSGFILETGAGLCVREASIAVIKAPGETGFDAALHNQSKHAPERVHSLNNN